MLYLISYDLRLGATTEDYQRIDAALTQFGARRVLLSQWVVRSNYPAQTIYNYVASVTDANDRLLVCEITTNWISSPNAMIDINTV